LSMDACLIFGGSLTIPTRRIYYCYTASSISQQAPTFENECVPDFVRVQHSHSRAPCLRVFSQAIGCCASSLVSIVCFQGVENMFVKLRRKCEVIRGTPSWSIESSTCAASIRLRQSIHTCMHACIHSLASEHTYMHAYIRTCIHTYIHTCMHDMHAYIHTYMHGCMHTYIHTCIQYIHTYIHPRICSMPTSYSAKPFSRMCA